MAETLGFFGEFMPHGMCFVWEPAILWLHVISDAFIALAYFFIPIALFHFVNQRADVPFRGVLRMFTVFILACGLTHTMGIWTVWYGHYGIQGLLKATTALASVATALMLIPVMPRLLALRTPNELALANQALEIEIAERKQSEAYAQRLLESAPDATIIFSQNQLIEFINKRAVEMFDYSKNELIGQHVQQLLSSDFIDSIDGLLDGNPKDFIAHKKDGTQCHVEISLSSVGTLDAPKIVASLRDRSDLLAIEEQTLTLQRDIAHLARLTTMGELATGLAHELQPLAAIVQNIDTAQLELKESGSPNPAIRELLGEIETDALRAGDIIRALRRFVRNEETERVPVDLNELVKRTINLIMPEARKNNVEITTRLRAIANPLADRTQIAQVLVNLLRNSIEAIASADSETREVVVESNQTNDNAIVISISDTGPGVDGNLTLFQPFESSKHDGMGMGLSISRSIIKAHGGELQIDEKFAAGARFMFNLPLGAPA